MSAQSQGEDFADLAGDLATVGAGAVFGLSNEDMVKKPATTVQVRI
jgi:hypothetical protein